MGIYTRLIYTYLGDSVGNKRNRRITMAWLSACVSMYVSVRSHSGVQKWKERLVYRWHMTDRVACQTFHVFSFGTYFGSCPRPHGWLFACLRHMAPTSHNVICCLGWNVVSCLTSSRFVSFPVDRADQIILHTRKYRLWSFGHALWTIGSSRNALISNQQCYGQASVVSRDFGSFLVNFSDEVVP